jgi:hypothetical protein
MKKCYTESRVKGTSYAQQNEKKNTILIGHFLLRNCSLKHVIGGKVRGKDRSDGKKRKKTEAAIG